MRKRIRCLQRNSMGCWSAALSRFIAQRCRTISARYRCGRSVGNCKLTGDNRARPGQTASVCEKTHHTENDSENDQLDPRRCFVVVPLYHPQQTQYELCNTDRPDRPVEV